MGEKAVVIGAGENSVHAIKVAQKNGMYVIGIDGNPNAEGLSIANESHIVDIKDYEKVSELVKKINPQLVIPIPIGRYLTTIGRINSDFLLKGPSAIATERSTDKYEFHRILAEQGIRNIQNRLVNRSVSFEELTDVQLPAIYKPRYGSGSRDVFFVDDRAALIKYYDYIVTCGEDFILENLVPGDEYGVDGAVIDGMLYITLIRKKVLTPIPARQAISYMAVSNNDSLYKRVRDMLSTAITALDYVCCLLHADIIINEDGVFPIEIAPRPSGHNLHDVFVPLATGVDMIQEYINYCRRDSYSFTSDSIRNLQIRFFDFENVVIKRVPTIDDIRLLLGEKLIVWNCNISEGDIMHSVSDGHSIMPRGYFVVEGKDEEALVKISNSVLNMFEME